MPKNADPHGRIFKPGRLVRYAAPKPAEPAEETAAAEERSDPPAGEGPASAKSPPRTTETDDEV